MLSPQYRSEALIWARTGVLRDLIEIASHPSSAKIILLQARTLSVKHYSIALHCFLIYLYNFVLDITIYDYAAANVNGKKGRLSKAVKTTIQSVQQFNQGPQGVLWEQRLQDGEYVEDETELVNAATVTGNICTHDNQTGPFLELPIDIWFAISEHVQPEDIGSFASICKSTRQVTKSARFWFSLYKRYYNKSIIIQLPDRLKPDCMVQRHGLQVCTIRALYLMYPPFIERVQNATRRNYNLQHLLRRRCIGLWYTRTMSWVFWFKLKLVNPRAERCVSRYNCVKSIVSPDSISTNEEKDCQVLQVSCSTYSPLPAAHGQILTKAQCALTQDMKANRLSLTFSNGTNIVLDPATNIQILNWWHPQYPHPLTIPPKCNTNGEGHEYGQLPQWDADEHIV